MSESTPHGHGLQIERGVRMPGYVVGIIAAVIVGAIGTGAAAVVDTRTNIARLEERVAQLEADRRDDHTVLASVPVALATLTTQMAAVQGDLAAIKASLVEHKR